MDKNIKNLTLISAYILGLFGVLLLIFIYFYKFSTINTYNFILLILMILTCFLALIFVVTIFVFFITYKKKVLFGGTTWALIIGLKLTMPFVFSISKFIKSDKELLQKFYIEVNNLFVEAKNIRYKPEDILIILPHCLQNSNCKFKVTSDVKLCERCGKCNLGDILSLGEKKGVKIEIVTGGTVARNIIKNYMPKLILSVACERDLLSGISDVGRLPVIGVLNKRPNGPCYNTFVDIDELKIKLEKVIKS